MTPLGVWHRDFLREWEDIGAFHLPDAAKELLRGRPKLLVDLRISVLKLLRATSVLYKVGHRSDSVSNLSNRRKSKRENLNPFECQFLQMADSAECQFRRVDWFGSQLRISDGGNTESTTVSHLP